MNSEQIHALFLNSGALLNGHFRLSSGRHSSEYWEKFKVLQRPRDVQLLCAVIVERYRSEQIDVVMGPTTGGIILAFETARQLGIDALYAEKDAEERLLRRGQQLPSGTRVLIIDDVMTMGGAVRECIGLSEKHEAHIVGTAVLVDRSGGKTILGYRQEALLTVEAATYAPEDCPLCRDNIPMTEPGSSYLKK